MRKTYAPRGGRAQVVAASMALLAMMIVVAGCGGGTSAEDRIDRPQVVDMSPFVSPIDFNTLNQNPTFTNPALTVSTDPAYPGRVVIKFQDSTVIDPASVFLGGDPALGLDPSSVQLTQEIPGTGNVQVPTTAVVDINGQLAIPYVLELQPILTDYATDLNPGLNVGDPDRWATNLPAGQYTIGVFANVKNSDGKNLVNGPVFHSFTVVDVANPDDVIAPRVLTTTPVNGQEGVGAGTPPPAGPPGFEDNVAVVTTAIFGPTTPDVTIRFTEGIQAVTVNASNFLVVDAGAFVPGGGAPPAIPPAPGFPMLKSAADGKTLPSNGHEVIWRADPLAGGFNFGTQIQVTVVGDDDGANGAPVADLAGNKMEDSVSFQFQTIAPPDLPQNPFPEYAIWWSASDRCGALDTINQQGLADAFFNPGLYPLGVPENVVPEFTDTVTTDQNIPNWDPFEIVIDTRTNFATCHTWVYVQSPDSGQVGIINSRDSVPVALISTPTPGGIACQTHRQGGPNVLLVTNSSANTWTAYSVGNLTPGTAFLNGPLFITDVHPTGNTPKAISISAPTIGGFPDNWNRGTAGLTGPSTELIMYVDFTDGVVNTATLADPEPVRQFALGPGAAPNDISLTPCFGNPPLLFAAISQGGAPGEGKVAYYLAGPGCITGASTPARPDSIVGDLTGFDAPAGISDVFAPINQAFWVVAESGSDRVSTLGFVTGTANVPDVKATFLNVGDNPTVVTTRPAYNNPCVNVAGSFICHPIPSPTCWYNGTEQDILLNAGPDGTLQTASDMFICARGAGFVKIIDQTTGALNFYNNVAIPGIRYVASTVRQ